jgi:Arc/MetJ family transcription regulator
VFTDTSEYTWEAKMRTNVVIDDEWMESALKLSGLKFKKDAIEEGLKLLVLVKCQEAIRAYFSFSLSAS